MLTQEQVKEIAVGWGNQAVDALVRDWRELQAQNERMREALTILRKANPIHNDWGLGENNEREDGLTDKPEWKG